MNARHHIANLLLIGAGMGFSSTSLAMTECEFIKRTMNKLGREMSINRALIASGPDQETEQKASELLSQQNKDFRLAKRQYQKARCENVWDQR
jgi:hypothetical protein